MQNLIPRWSASQMAAHQLDAVDRQLATRRPGVAHPGTKIDGLVPGPSERDMGSKHAAVKAGGLPNMARKSGQRAIGIGDAIPGNSRPSGRREGTDARARQKNGRLSSSHHIETRAQIRRRWRVDRPEKRERHMPRRRIGPAKSD